MKTEESWLDRYGYAFAMVAVGAAGIALVFFVLLRTPSDHDIRVQLQSNAAFRDDAPAGSKVTCGFGAIYFERLDAATGLWEGAQVEDEKGNHPAHQAQARGTWYLPPGHLRVRVEP